MKTTQNERFSKGNSNGDMIAIILIATLIASAQQSVAQDMSGPNRLIEATRYAARAHRDLECSDENIHEPIVSARTWTEKAIETARRFRTRDKIEQGEAAAFIAREEQTLSDLTETQKNLDKAAVSVTKALKGARLDTAARLHADAKFGRLRVGGREPLPGNRDLYWRTPGQC
jgi:hypothetical protein